jgi:exodeoxyribonuclease VII large subunit
MSHDDLFTAADRAPDPEKTAGTGNGSNVPEMSVSDLALTLKRTLEDTFGHIRVRGELSGLKLAASGHLYGDIKDVDANINIVCWRGTMSRLSLKPADGMDVIVTGKVSSYPKSSRYQIIVETIELAGEGALLKLLEERRKKLAAEGLFDPARKKKLPFLPERIGVITSPTGAVIRDILHRLKERFPRHVLLWPVAVQGDGSAEQVANAVHGFNQLSPPYRPDLLIIARGGGSLEDLMSFNDEAVVRAIAASTIPTICAVGHETDTTLSDYAADLRAPTPTGAAEMAVPVRLQLLAQVQDDSERLFSAAVRMLRDGRNLLARHVAEIGRPQHILETRMQALDHAGERLGGGLSTLVRHKRADLQELSAALPAPRHMVTQKLQTLTHTGQRQISAIRSVLQNKKSILKETGSLLTSPRAALEQKQQKLTFLDQRLLRTTPHLLQQHRTTLQGFTRILSSLSPKSVLERGYALVYDENGNLVRESASIGKGQELTVEFAGGDRMTARREKA